MARRYYSSTAVATTLSGSLNNSSTSVSVTALSGFPAQVPWTALIDKDTASEEVVTVTNVSGTTLTVTRGVDGTTAVSHNAGATFSHGVSARDFDEANSHVNDSTTDVHGQYILKSFVDAKGDLLTATADNTPARLAVGTTNGHVLQIDSTTATGLKWAAPVLSGTYLGTLVYTSSSSFTKASYPTLSAMLVEVVGGGGGGGYVLGSTGNALKAGGGGGGGGYAMKYISNIAGLSASETITVGGAGSGGVTSTSTAATNGGNSSFSSVTANGGTAGTSNSAGDIGGAGGSASGGDLNITGGYGGGGSGHSTNVNIGVLPGGSTLYGFGGRGMLGGARAGQVGSGYGAGGSGAWSAATATASDGGAGTAGLVILHLFG